MISTLNRLSTLKAMGDRNMKKPGCMIYLILGLALFGGTLSADACSCEWKGAFLKVAKDSPLIVHGRVLRHHAGSPPIMDVLVLETLMGGMFDSGMAIQMGDGAACRPSMADFAPGSEWIFALNGPGSKPGAGLALSHCGEYWLRIEDGDVVGIIDGSDKQTRRMPLQELRNRLRYPRFDERFSGRVEAGKHYRRLFGGRFEMVLESTAAGWMIMVKEIGREEDLARLTPPFHSVPNPREIEGWHLLDQVAECASRPYQAESGPSNPRMFIFSPDVGGRIDGAIAKRSVSAEDVEEVRRFGRGILSIETFELQPKSDGCPTIRKMTFSVRLTGGY
jgi:hypothetical protein